MTDAASRVLERAAAASGDTESRVAALTARRRAGTIDDTRLAIAGYSGDRAAAIVCPWSRERQARAGEPGAERQAWAEDVLAFVASGMEVTSVTNFRSWAEHVSLWPNEDLALEACVRAALAAGEETLIRLCDIHGRYSQHARTLEAVRGWLVGGKTLELGRAAARLGERVAGSPWAEGPAMAAWAATGDTLHADLVRDSLLSTALGAARVVGWTNGRKGRPVVWKAMREALLAWALK